MIITQHEYHRISTSVTAAEKLRGNVRGQPLEGDVGGQPPSFTAVQVLKACVRAHANTNRSLVRVAATYKRREGARQGLLEAGGETNYVHAYLVFLTSLSRRCTPLPTEIYLSVFVRTIPSREQASRPPQYKLYICVI